MIGALQNYWGWRKVLRTGLAEAEALLSAEPGSDGVGCILRLQAVLHGGKLLETADQCAATHLLMRRYPSLRIACLEETGGGGGGGGGGGFAFASVLYRGVTADAAAAEPDGAAAVVDPVGVTLSMVACRRVALRRSPIADGLAEGKATNQASALLHCDAELLMVNDCNQGADLEQFFFLPRLMQEFRSDGEGRHAPSNRTRLVGFKEHIFSETDGLVARSGALNEYVFGTIVQRQLHISLGARLHYGHPDVFDFGFVLTQGGASKLSRTINVSEDIFGGINMYCKGGGIRYVDYVQVDKGRDMQYDAALGFESKIAGGTAVHALSRDYERLQVSPLALFQKASLLAGSLGYFFSNTLLVLSMQAVVAMHAAAVMLPADIQRSFYAYTPSYLTLFNLGFVYAIALMVQLSGDRGVRGALVALAALFASLPLALAKMKAHQSYVRRGIVAGLAKYVATGRDLATKRVGFRDTFARYAHTHFAPAFDMGVLLLVVHQFSIYGSTFYWNTTGVLWLVLASWLLSPMLYNPHGLELQTLWQDALRTFDWLSSDEFDHWRLGQAPGAREGDFARDNWFCWLNTEPLIYQLLVAVSRAAFYAPLSVWIVASFGLGPSSPPSTPHRLGASELLTVVLFAALLVHAMHVRASTLRTASAFMICAWLLGVVILGSVASCVRLSLAAFCAAKAGQGALELAAALLATSQRRGALLTATHGAQQLVPTALLMPLQLRILCLGMVADVSRVYYGAQAALSLGLSLVIAILLLVPILPFAAVSTLAISFYCILGGTFSLQDAIALATISAASLIAILLGSGSKVDRTAAAQSSHLRLWLLALNFGVLHSCLVMNRSVAQALLFQSVRPKAKST